VPKLCICGGSGEIFSGAFSEQDLEGNRNPWGGTAEAEERVAAGRMKSPDAVPEQRRDTETADTRQSIAFICTVAAEVQRNGSLFRTVIPGTRAAHFATVVASRKAHVRRLPKEREQVGIASRIVSVNGHE
jgi:hypothetical protein